MAKFAEKLTILQAANENLLDRVYFAKRALADKPILQAEKIQKFNQAVLKSFPEIPSGYEKMAGFDMVKSRSEEIVDDFGPHYNTFIDALEFKEAALTLLKDISDSTVALKFDENAELMLAFMNLVVGFVQLNLLLGAIADRRAVVVLYAISYRLKESFAEQNISRLAMYFSEYESPLRRMQDDMAPLSSRVGETLMNLVMTYNKCTNTTILRKENALTLIQAPDKLTVPIQDHFRFELVYMGRFYLWIVYGFLFCPAAITPESMELLRAALNDGWVAPIYRDEVLAVHAEFDTLFNWYVNPQTQFKLQKHKKLVAEATQVAVERSGIAHRERRVYLRQEMNQLFNLLSDRPGLLGPKIQIVFAALSLAKDEVFWYFRHFDKQPPKAKGKFDPNTYLDSQITDIIYLLDQLSALVLKHKPVIQAYFVEYLSGPDHDRVKEALAQTQQRLQLDSGVTKILKALEDGLAEPTVSALQSGKTFDLEPLRLNWFRVVAVLSSVQSSIRLTQMKDLVTKLQLAITHSRNVDRIEKSLKEFSSLHELYYFKETFARVFTDSLAARGPQPFHWPAFIRIINTFSSNATRALPDERIRIGNEAVQTAENCIKTVCTKIAQLLEGLTGKDGFGELNRTIAPSYAGAVLHARQNQKAGNEVQYAGSESRADQRRSKLYQALLYWETNLTALCSAMKDAGILIVHDHALAPTQYLREHIKSSFRDFVARLLAVNPETGQMQRPSVLLGHIKSYLSLLKMVERYAAIDVDAIARSVLLGHFVDKTALGAQGQLENLTLAPSKEAEAMLIHKIAQWFVEFLFRRVTMPNSGIVFSPAKQAFVSRAGMPFRADDYVDVMELKALFALTGPYGARVIDNYVLRLIAKHVGKLKEILSANKEALDNFKKAFPKEPGTAEALKKIRNIDQFAQISVQVGIALSFRNLLRQALRQSMEAHTPFIHHCVSSLTALYPPNIFGEKDLLSTDLMALDAGIILPNSDPALRAVLQSLNTNRDDNVKWDMLGWMFAVLLVAPLWQTASYRAVLDGHSNNAHCLAVCIHQLLITVLSFTYLGDPQGTQKLAEVEKVFVETSALMLVRMKGDPNSSLAKGLDVPSMFVFMHKFLQGTNFLSVDVLTSIIPYAVMRSAYLYLYESQRRGVREETDKAGGNVTEDTGAGNY